jgi:AhpD family alkylhydroperoxidase
MKDYPEIHRELKRQIGRLNREAPEAMGGFAQLHRGAITDGVLPRRTKELIAVGIAVTSRCDGCIAFHVHDALKHGATREELVEAITVAVLMGGGPAQMYASDALLAVDQFIEARETVVAAA